MALTDLTLPELREFAPDVAEPDDFDAFWRDTLAESRSADTGFTISPVETPITSVIIEDLTFSGYAGDPIKAWITRPRDAVGPLPTVIEYIGYNGGRGIPGERLLWASAGYAHILMDTRGQGSGWGSGGDTPDPHGSGPATAGFMTRGILDPATYFYRRVFTDAVRLIDLAVTLPFVDADRIAVTGGSQGGGISLAAAALSDHVKAAMPDVPFLCHFRRSVDLTASDPFAEIRRYLAVHRDRVQVAFETLSYFDGVNFARRISVPSLFSAAMMDDIVLPSSIFAAYNHLAAADKQIEVYEFNGHEGGLTQHWLAQTHWLASRI